MHFWPIILTALFLAHSVQAQNNATFNLSPEVLAFCLSQGEILDRLDTDITEVTEKRRKLLAIHQELQLHLGSLRDTARIDANAATEYRALQFEQKRLTAAQVEALKHLDQKLEERHAANKIFHSHCAGRSYSEDDMDEAKRFRERLRATEKQPPS